MSSLHRTLTVYYSPSSDSGIPAKSDLSWRICGMDYHLILLTDVEVPAPPVLPTFQHTEGSQGLVKARGICFSHQDLAGSLMEEELGIDTMRRWMRVNGLMLFRRLLVITQRGMGGGGERMVVSRCGGVRGSAGIFKRSMAKKGLLV
ncbi:Protein of unknown function [Pyronema omphalodes CBS 100304]|uniref:Uncharacterized protein n=1 Tax=Pyronema omphalodes (strain CBS 100304) TaxID=1076935 RepID=U4L2P1_PYROM|nr:Protein of unknown function [Pyronema omphalodes CBS 100304]